MVDQVSSDTTSLNFLIYIQYNFFVKMKNKLIFFIKIKKKN